MTAPTIGKPILTPEQANAQREAMTAQAQARFQALTPAQLAQAKAATDKLATS